MRLRNGKTYFRYQPYKKKTSNKTITEDTNEIKCMGCNRLWDGYAQCTCWFI